MVEQYLSSRVLDFAQQKSFAGLCGKKGRLLRYDFALPLFDDRYVLIEYNGKQHYEPVKYYGGQKAFEYRVLLDKKKAAYASEHGYPLIVIPYTVRTYKKIAEFLDDALRTIESQFCYVDAA